MTREPLVSILTPTYNHSDYIDQCVTSVLEQTYPHWEMFILDDGSTDDTIARVRAFGDSRVQVLALEHRGPEKLADTYNHGLERSSGSLVALLEGDDWWEPDKLARQVPLFADPDTVLAYGVTAVVDEQGSPSGVTYPTAQFQSRFPEALRNVPLGTATRAMLHPAGQTFTSPQTVVIRRSTLDRIGGFQAVAGLPLTDYPTFLEVSLWGEYAFVDQVLGYWRRHSGAVTSSGHADVVEGMRACALDFAERKGVDIGITAAQLDALRTEWRRVDAWLARSRGRAALNGRNWSAAIAAYGSLVRHAIRERSRRTRTRPR